MANTFKALDHFNHFFEHYVRQTACYIDVLLPDVLRNLQIIPASPLLVTYFLSYVPSTINTSLVPLLALASFPHIAHRTIQTGTSSLLDTLALCPGIHKQSTASALSKGEYPATAAMTTGYVFRVENQAMVHYLQRIGVTGSLVTVAVSECRIPSVPGTELLLGPGRLDSARSLTALVAAFWTLDVWRGCRELGDQWAVACIYLLILSRALNMAAIRRRLVGEWHGAREPGTRGDLLVLLSQDRWVRIQGLVDDIKAVTSGQWLRDEGYWDRFLADSGTTLVYAAVVAGSNASQHGTLMIATLLLGTSALLGLSSLAGGRTFWMHGRMVEVVAQKRYERRSVLAHELIKESGRDDWAVQMGVIPGKEKGVGLAIM